MSAQNEGRQSPSPEQSTGAQQNDPTANAKGVDSGSDNKQENKDQLENLTSNPEGPLEAHRKETAKKTVKNVAGETDL